MGDSVCCGLKGTGSDSRNRLYIGPASSTASCADNNHPRMVVHNGRIDLSFADGHTMWFKASAVQRDTFSPRNGP